MSQVHAAIRFKHLFQRRTILGLFSLPLPARLALPFAEPRGLDQPASLDAARRRVPGPNHLCALLLRVPGILVLEQRQQEQ